MSYTPRSHWDNCYLERDHHDCALREIIRLRGLLDEGIAFMEAEINRHLVDRQKLIEELAKCRSA